MQIYFHKYIQTFDIVKWLQISHSRTTELSNKKRKILNQNLCLNIFVMDHTHGYFGYNWHMGLKGMYWSLEYSEVALPPLDTTQGGL